MHTTRGYYQLSQYHLAGLRHQAQRCALARAARRTRAHQSTHSGPALPVFACHALAMGPRNR